MQEVFISILPFLAILGQVVFLNTYCKVPYNKAFCLSVGILLFGLYVGALCGQLKLTADCFDYVGWALLLITILKCFLGGRNAFRWKDHRALFGFLLFLAFLYVKNWNRYISSWDEFSFWGFAPFEVVRLDALFTPQNSPIGFTWYLPGPHLFEYYGFRWLPDREGMIYLMRSFWILSILFLFLGNKNWKINCLVFFLAQVFLSAIPSGGSREMWTDLYADRLLALTFAAFLYAGWQLKGKAIDFWVYVALAVQLLLVKEIGFKCALIGFTATFLMLLWTPISWKKRLFFMSMALGIILFIHVSWEQYTTEGPYWTGRLEMIQQFFTALGNPDNQQAIVGFLKAFFTASIHSTNAIKIFPFVIVFLIAGLLTLQIRFCTDAKKSSTVIGPLIAVHSVLFVGLIFYLAIRLNVYLNIFTIEQRNSVDSYSRYIGAYLIGWFLFSCLTLLPQLIKSTLCPKKAKIALCVAIGLLFLPQAKGLVKLVYKSPPPRSPIAEKVLALSEQLKKIAPINTPTKALLIWQGSTGFPYWMFQMRIAPHSTPPKWSFRAQEFEAPEIEYLLNNDLSQDEFQKLLLKNDYIVIGKDDASFWKNYGVFFDRQDAQIYKLENGYAKAVEEKKKKKILFVGLPTSIHTVRWLSIFENTEYEVYLFPSIPERLNKGFYKTHPYAIGFNKPKQKAINVISLLPSFSLDRFVCRQIRSVLKRVPFLKNKWGITEESLAKCIEHIQPDLIHSLEFQTNSYLTLRAKKLYEKSGKKFPAWMASNWGNDIYFFSRLPDYREQIKLILKEIDFYFCESERDLAMAIDLGMDSKKHVFPILHNTVGCNFEELGALGLPPSERKIIFIKGYQSVFGRAMNIVDAISLLSDEIVNNYIVVITSCTCPFLKSYASLLFASKGIQYDITTGMGSKPHSAILELLSKSRVYIGLSVSDGATTNMLEAMSMGAFPIQSDSSTGDEWFENGRSGFLVPYYDVVKVAACLKEALENDALVDEAALINRATAEEKYNYTINRKKILDGYNSLLNL